jgi:hypothetical protein
MGRRVGCWMRVARVSTLIGVGLSTPLESALAQSAPSGHEPVVLRLHPRVGDTLHTRLEQQTETSGSQSGNQRPMTTSVMVAARTIVQTSRATTTTVLTIVDSAMVRSSDPRGASMSAQAERTLLGQRLVLQLAEDGSVQSARDERGVAVSRDVAEAMAAMPPVLPHRAVSVGEKWEREMPLPSSGPFGARGSAHVRAAFRLDSLGRNGEVAYVSMRGEIAPDGEIQGLQLTGNVSGSMRVDRVRGWMTDSKFSILIKSIVTPPATTGMSPMHFVTKVTQHLRTMDKR